MLFWFIGMSFTFGLVIIDGEKLTYKEQILTGIVLVFLWPTLLGLEIGYWLKELNKQAASLR